MSISDNKAVARRFIGVWGKADLNIITELAVPELVVHYPVLPQPVQGRESFQKVMANFRSAFPDSDIQTGDVIAEGDKVVVRWTFTGTHQGNFLGLAPTGKKVRWTGITIYVISGGRVVEEKGEEDMLGFLRQIGSVPSFPTISR
jgi:steroid delta-isomerase-like uncharacterized protein